MKDQSHDELNVLAIVVSYNPDDEFNSRLAKAKLFFGRVLVVDNGSSDTVFSKISRFAATSGIDVIRNAENAGLARALNQGIAFAESSDAEFVYTFDQDSSCEEGYHEAMMSALRLPMLKTGDIGLLSPVYRDEQSGVVTRYATRAINAEIAEIPFTLTSGNLVPLETFRRIGGFDESLFIDYLDYDFCLRCRKNKLGLYEVRNAVLNHNLGRSELKTLPFGRNFFVTHHSALRRYYITRNRLVVSLRYAGAFPNFFVKESVRFLIDLAKIICFERDKVTKISNVLKGVFHAAVGRRGVFK